MRCSLEASMELAMIIRTKVTDYKSATEFNQQFFKNYSCEVATSISIGRSPTHHTSHSNSALKGRDHFFAHRRIYCKMRWSKNVKTHHREMVWW